MQLNSEVGRCSTPNLQKKLKRVLDNLLDLLEPLSTDGTVNDLVVEAGSEGDLVVELNAGLVVGGDGNLLGGTNGKDGGLRRVDDGSEVVNSGVHTHVGDGDGTALVLLGLELAVTSLLGKRLDLRGDGLKTTALDTSDDRGDKTSGGGNGDGNVDVVELADVTIAPAGVDLRDLSAGNGDGLDKEVVDGELVLAVGRGVESLAELEKLADGKRAGDEEVRVGLGGLDQAVGNGLAHAADGDVLVGSAGGASGGAADGLLDIGLSDLSVLAGTLKAIDADTLLAGKSLGGSDNVGLTVESSLETALRLVLLGLRRRLGGGSRLRLGLRLLLLRGSGLSGITTSVLDGELLESGDIGTLLNENGNGAANRNILLTSVLQDLGDNTLFLELEVHLGLVGLNLDEDVTGGDGITDLLLPGTNVASLHGGGQSRHLDNLVLGERGIVSHNVASEAGSQSAVGRGENAPSESGAEHCGRY